MRIIFIILLCVPQLVFSQVNPNFTQFFVNPYLLNPAYAGADAQSTVILSYRSQWTGFEGAPQIGNLSFHTPLGSNVGIGLNISNEQRSILNTSSFQASASYSLKLGTGNYLRFGMSAGGASNSVDIMELDNIADPAINGILDNSMFVTGNAGMLLQIKSFNFGVSIPSLFTESYSSEEDFAIGDIEPVENVVLSVSNRFYFAGDKHVFEPFLIYRYSDIYPPQIEAAAVIHINHLIYAGGSYRQDFGISAFGGIKVNKILGIGYSYGLANTGINEINSPTHEVHLSLLFGSKNKKRSTYSFVNTEKELPVLAQRTPVKKPEIVEEETEPAEEEAQPEEKAKAEPTIEKVSEDKKASEVKKAVEEKDEEKVVEKKPEEKIQPQVTPVREKPVETKKEDTQSIIKPPVEPKRPKEAEKKVVVKRGKHYLELEEGNFVVVGAFSVYDNAEKFSDQLFDKGYATKFGYTSEKGLWYVYLFRSDSIEEARSERDEARQNGIFSKAWVLTVVD